MATTIAEGAAAPVLSDTNTPENIARLVELGLQTEHIGVGPARVKDTAQRVHADFGFDKHPFVSLAATCVEHGLSPSAVRCLPEELVLRIDEGMMVAVARPDGSFLALVNATGSHHTTAYNVANGRVRPLRGAVDRVLRLLGRQPVDAMTIETTYPLDALRTLPGSPSGSFRRLWGLARLERSELTMVLVYAVFIGLLTLVLPVSVQALVNTIAFGAVLQPLIILGVALFAGLVLSAVLQVLRAHVVEVLQRRIFARVVNDFGRRLPRLAAEVHRTRDPRELANRFFDVVTVQKSAAGLAIETLGLALQTAMGLLLLAFYHPMLLAFDVVLVAVLIIVIRLPLSKSAKSAIYESKAKYATAAWLQTIAEDRSVFADARGARHASAHAEALSQVYLDRRADHWRHLLTQIVGGQALHVVASVALLLLGGWLVMERQLTIGQLVASELVVALVGAGFAKLGKQMEKLYDAAAAVDKIVQVVDTPRERDGGVLIESDAPARIELDAISDRRLSSTIDLTVEEGETIAITGGPAAGKTALLEMILGRFTPDRGCVRIDRVDLAEADLRHYRTGVCVIEHNARASDLTIAEMLRLAAPAATTTDMRDALAWVGLTDAIARLPDGMNQRLLPSGAPLTPTELLRVSVARLLLSQPRLAIIDGALDALADETGLLDAVLDGPWTTVVTTNSAAVIAKADRTLHLARIAPEETA